jgi:hypothetical protein
VRRPRGCTRPAGSGAAPAPESRAAPQRSEAERAAGGKAGWRLAVQIGNGEYRRWLGATADAVDVPAGSRCLEQTPGEIIHAQKIRIFVNPAGKESFWPKRSASFAPGSMILREAVDDGASPADGIRFAAMVKHAPPAFAASGGWQFVLVGRADARTFYQDASESCYDCHRTQQTSDGVFATYPVPAEPPPLPYPEAREAMRAYQEALAALEKPGAGGVERLVRLSDELRDRFFAGNGADDSPAFLESLSEAEFERLPQELPGLRFNREESLNVVREASFYEALVERHGDEGDRRFFAASARTRPGGVWASYLRQVTDFQACTDYGTGELVQAYRIWTEFQRDFPDRYPEAVASELRDIGTDVVRGDCACGDAAAFEKEFAAFVEAFPHSPLRAAVAERLQRFRAGTLVIRTQCRPS